jgi:hypothetical protein
MTGFEMSYNPAKAEAEANPELKAIYRKKAYMAFFFVYIWGFIIVLMFIYRVYRDGVDFLYNGIFGIVLLNIAIILFGGIIYPYWRGYIKFDGSQLMIRPEPWIKPFRKRLVSFSLDAELFASYNTKTRRMAFANGTDEVLLILAGLPDEYVDELISSLKKNKNVVLDIDK